MVGLLHEELSAGRIDLTEFEERTEGVMAARTGRDLVPLLSDLPVQWRPEGARSTPEVRRPGPAPTEPAEPRSAAAVGAPGPTPPCGWPSWCCGGGSGPPPRSGSGELLFPWPIFPSLAMAFPLLIGFFRRVLGADDD